MEGTSAYCNSLTGYSRFQTRVVKIGNLEMGGENPIRVQSMTTTDTLDTLATVQQSIRMIESGCELVRVTAPSIKEAQNLENIKRELRARGYNTPLVADIHFTPNAAELAARIVEKVRINPGNYADKKKFEHFEYTDEAYARELERIRDRFVPLVRICKEYGTAMRIGTNHGSLSDRILSRYGDTPQGMVESALEFLRICEDEGYYNIVLSMKASNTRVMVQAYRLLVSHMIEQGMNYPLHLGVTEAGEGEDGRIKSAVGIGTLLEDGLGDTIRVSLTEDPEHEAPVARALVNRYANRTRQKENQWSREVPAGFSPFEYSRRHSRETINLGGTNVPRVIAVADHVEAITPASLFAFGYKYSVNLDKWNISDQAADIIYAGNKTVDFEIPGTVAILQNAEAWEAQRERHFPLFTLHNYFSSARRSSELNFIEVDATVQQEEIISIANDPTVVLIVSATGVNAVAELRSFFFRLLSSSLQVPAVIKAHYSGLSDSDFQLYSATDMGALLTDGFSDGVMLNATGCGSKSFINSTAFGILQAARTRISKTEYISCPSCGRTLFDLQETTTKIRKVTDHLKGVKIGIMGCIVNGPGEMADADYGYVGTGVGKITLYKGKEVVKRNIPSEDAVDQLIELIKENGDWVERSEGV